MINKVIRFIWIDRNSNHKKAIIPREYQWCIMSAVVMNPDYEVVVHTNIPLDYDILINDKFVKNELISNELIEKAHSCGINKVIEHVSDYVRYNILYEYGGFYLDTDMFCIKSFNDLLDNRAILAKETSVRVCCAAFGFEKNHELIKMIIDEYHNNYLEDKYVYNSQIYLFEKSKEFDKKDVKILKHEEGFFYPNWKFNSMIMFYNDCIINSKEDMNNKFNCYAHHMWSTNPNGKKLKNYLIENINTNDNFIKNSYIIQLFNFYLREYNNLLNN